MQGKLSICENEWYDPVWMQSVLELCSQALMGWSFYKTFVGGVAYDYDMSMVFSIGKGLGVFIGSFNAGALSEERAKEG